jgi:hypothetical protein
VVSIWRIAITLAMLVAVITASSSRKLPKVSCPIDSDIDRTRLQIAANAAGILRGSAPRNHIIDEPRYGPENKLQTK